MLSCSRNRASNPPTSSSLAEKERLRSLLLRTAARDFPTLAAMVETPYGLSHPGAQWLRRIFALSWNYDLRRRDR
jgi:hypothetical protein